MKNMSLDNLVEILGNVRVNAGKIYLSEKIRKRYDIEDGDEITFAIDRFGFLVIMKAKLPTHDKKYDYLIPPS